MIIGIGTDIVNIKRIAKKQQDLANRILTFDELNIYNALANNKQKLEFLAGRFAGKEAYMKATELNTFRFKDIEILKKANGAPYINSVNENVYISISHTDNDAIAYVVIEK